METICLTYNQARHIYKKVESESVVNVDVINTILYLPQVHWGYHQTLILSQLAMG